MTKPHSDECRARMDELMQRDEDASMQPRLRADRLRRGSTLARSSGDERRIRPAGREQRRCTPSRRRTEVHVGSDLPAGSSGAPRAEGADELMGTAEDSDVRRGLKRSAELPLDDLRETWCAVVENTSI